jgi:hypothetical protein
MDLSRWSVADYRPDATARLLLALGASPYRCPYCRVNFVSFRKRKERYVRRKRVTVTAEKPVSVTAEPQPQEVLAKKAGAGE